MLIGIDGLLSQSLLRVYMLLHLRQPLVALHEAQSLVDACYLILVPSEVTLRLQIVEDCRHKTLPVALSTYLSTIGSHVAHPWHSVLARPLRFFGALHDQHTKHLSTVYLLAPIVTLSEFLLQLLASQDAERVRLITERIVHRLRHLNARRLINV